MKKIDFAALFIIIVLILLVTALIFEALPKKNKDSFRIAWIQGNKTNKQDVPADGRVYFLFTHHGVFYMDSGQGQVYRLTNWSQLGKDHQVFVKKNLQELIKKEK